MLGKGCDELAQRYVEELTTIVIYDNIFGEANKKLTQEPEENYFNSMQLLDEHYEASFEE